MAAQVSYKPSFSSSSSYSVPVSALALSNQPSRNAALGSKLDTVRGALENEFRNLNLPGNLAPSPELRSYLASLILSAIPIDHTNRKVLCACTYISYIMLYGDENMQRTLLPYPGGNLLSVVTEQIKMSLGLLKQENAVTGGLPQEIRNLASDQLFSVFVNSIEIGEKISSQREIQNKYFTLFIRYLKYIFQQLLNQ